MKKIFLCQAVSMLWVLLPKETLRFLWSENVISKYYVNTNITDDTIKMLLRQWQIWKNIIITTLGQIELAKVIWL